MITLLIAAWCLSGGFAGVAFAATDNSKKPYTSPGGDLLLSVLLGAIAGPLFWVMAAESWRQK